MAIQKNPSLLTPDQVAQLIDQWGMRSEDEFAAEFGVDRSMIDRTISLVRRLRRVTNSSTIPAMSCFRNGTLEAVVECAGARKGYAF